MDVIYTKKGSTTSRKTYTYKRLICGSGTHP
nr:MAG TPA: hypothetical protein [Caudoviricetes sp.]